jgi:hypothetical protein
MPEMNEDELATKMLTTWLTFELLQCGYPIKCASDVMALRFAIEQSEIVVVTRDINKIAILIHAIKTFIAKFIECRDEIAQAAIKLADDLRVEAQNALAEIQGESHLELN